MAQDWKLLQHSIQDIWETIKKSKELTAILFLQSLKSWGSSPSCLIFKEFLCLFVTLYLEGFICKEEGLAGMGLLQPSGTESNISFSIKNAHLCHLNSTDTLWCFLRRVRLLGWRYQIIPFAANMQANIHLYLSKSNCKHLKIIIWLSHFN